ncbi:sugar transporter [Vibrio sp. HA2012]|uniref:polysaccharide biosynthesis/export family protein n=1 Tax=Vibrio sp. HA2012 TaxID=1971595 RepID=UPI000C2C46E3|nr:polysaccharide biosynthesis/export family protein [Vibrio sp. HA2012]PJC88041.1 sugar transporter [Vibrio sp. HA2012]
MYNAVIKTLLLFFCLFPLAANSALASVNERDYVISAGDTIRITVYGEVDMSVDELLIDSSGKFDFPYLGELNIENKTLKEIQQLITDGLEGDYLVSPKVTVNIVRYRNIYVNGVVNNPGAYEYQPGLTVEKAIALAGGFISKYRKTKDIYLTRNNQFDGLTEEQIKDALENQGEVDLAETVNPGDTVYVVSSFW